MPPVLPPSPTEAALLLACARTRLDAGEEERLATLLLEPLDWGRILGTAAHHGVVPLVHACLGRVPGQVPAAAIQRLRLEARANVHHSLFLTAELTRLTRALAAAGVSVVPFKGPVLAAAAYGDVTLRQFTDLDIFVRRSDVPAVTRLLLSHGYLSNVPDRPGAIERALGNDREVAYLKPKHYTFFRPDGRSRIDLQWRMAEEFFAFSLDQRGLGGQLWPVSVAGHVVHTFTPTDTLLVLCAHGSKHRWEKLKWLCDVAELLRTHGGDIDWRQLENTAAALRVRRILDLGLRLALDVLGAPLPHEVSSRVRADRALDRLVRGRRDALFAGDDERPRPLARALFHLRTKDDWQGRAGFCANYVRQRTTVALREALVETGSYVQNLRARSSASTSTRVLVQETLHVQDESAVAAEDGRDRV